MAAQHRFVRAFAHHRSITRALNRPAALIIAAAAVLTCLTGTALGKGGYIRRSEPVPLSRAETPTSQSAKEFMGGCGRGRYRSKHAKVSRPGN
jgi:hypothetical protein